ncbi:hypothetical protein WG66_008239 [Moniliophthora roreri]|nr:hypothetical protein WG66_008239 [Moniliophthora roreri]
MALRIYALYSPDRRILWFPGITVMCAVVLAGYGLSGQGEIDYPVPMVCHIGISRQTPPTGIVSLWLALFIYDMITFILTAARTYKFWRKDNIQPLRMGLFPLLFRDGAIYFAVMAQANLANILTFYLCGVSALVSSCNCAPTALTTIIPAIYARWSVDIRQLYLSDNAMPPHAQPTFDRQYWFVHPTRYDCDVEDSNVGYHR